MDQQRDPDERREVGGQAERVDDPGEGRLQTSSRLDCGDTLGGHLERREQEEGPPGPACPAWGRQGLAEDHHQRQQCRDQVGEVGCGRLGWQHHERDDRQDADADTGEPQA